MSWVSVNEPSFGLAIRIKLTHNGKVPMSHDIITTMDDSVGRLQSLFPPEQFEVLVGSLLGDARLECRSRGIRNAKTARFRVHALQDCMSP